MIVRVLRQAQAANVGRWPWRPAIRRSSRRSGRRAGRRFSPIRTCRRAPTASWRRWRSSTPGRRTTWSSTLQGDMPFVAPGLLAACAGLAGGRGGLRHRDSRGARVLARRPGQSGRGQGGAGPAGGRPRRPGALFHPLDPLRRRGRSGATGRSGGTSASTATGAARSKPSPPHRPRRWSGARSWSSCGPWSSAFRSGPRSPTTRRSRWTAPPTSNGRGPTPTL